jgi:hypothetical protein
MRAMDRRARECEAASLLLAALHPKLIDPQQVGALPPPCTRYPAQCYNTSLSRWCMHMLCCQLARK